MIVEGCWNCGGPTKGGSKMFPGLCPTCRPFVCEDGPPEAPAEYRLEFTSLDSIRAHALGVRL